jgi:succinate dehydrogenase/fumarate reductase-like Fe-S protein
MFRLVDDTSVETLKLSIEGGEYEVPVGISVAAAVLLCGFNKVRNTPVTGAPRLPYCMMGICFDCLVTIDGIPNQQACQLGVRESMIIEVQDGAAELLQQR